MRLMIIATIGFLFAMFSILLSLNSDTGIFGLILFLVGMGLMFFAVVGKLNEVRENEEQKQQIIEEAQQDAENGYKLYINGQEVELNTINLDDYEITIKDDDKIIVLSD